jgi:hypothetical protein
MRCKSVIQSLGACRQGVVRGEGVVFFLTEGPEVSERREAEQGGGEWVLESHGDGQADPHEQRAQQGGREEGARVLPRQGAQGREDQLDHARVPPRDRPHQPLRRPATAPIQGNASICRPTTSHCLTKRVSLLW